MRELKTPWSQPGEVPWNEYPRPRLRRREWLCLNGTWTLSAGGKTCPVLVPFPVESALSGVTVPCPVGTELIYRRTFETRRKGGRFLIHFGAVMRKSQVFLNGERIGGSQDGYLPFTCEGTEQVRTGENTLEVRCVNDLDWRFGWGKQTVKRGGMWYTPASGIWQTVWAQWVPREYIKNINVATGGAIVTIEAEGVRTGTVFLGERQYALRDGRAEFYLDDARFWSPEDPYLYEFTLVSGEDEVQSYFALRDLGIRRINGKKRLCLNGKPYFFHGLLDQGYWPDGIYTPGSPEAFLRDIEAMKSLGFNTLRKHIKVEPELWYYYCDKLGMAVFQDMVSSGRYDYMRDTALPTLGFRRRDDRKLHRDETQRRNFLAHMAGVVRHLKSQPSIVLWTIFNEGWGQFESDRAYDLLKAMDPTRFIDSTSGWFHQKKSDVDSLHLYFEELRLGSEDKAQLLSEYGGWSYKLPEHSFNLEKTYGY
ncbi:MAG: glycoside hydrolase family 2, partial [Oscillospiraceae bacterium]|nr:glycoside hydrolase family 2 [Oscillospiraceae bacterium]